MTGSPFMGAEAHLPSPSRTVQIDVLLRRVQQGRRATEATDELIRKSEAWIVRPVTKNVPLSLQDDVAQVARLAILKAVKHFRSGRGASFLTYATTCARRAVTAYLLQEATYTKHVVLDEGAALDDSQPASSEQTPESRLLEAERRRAIEAVTDQLPPPLQYVFRETVLAERTQSAVSKGLGLHKQTVNKQYHRSVRLVRERVAEYATS